MLATETRRPTRVRVTLPALLPWQYHASRMLDEDGARFLVLLCGRQAGKSHYAGREVVECALGGGAAWWIAPDYPLASVGWRLLQEMTRGLPGVTVLKAERRMDFANGGWVQVKSASNPDSLRGATLDLVVCDEAAFMDERAWSEALRPTLARRGGSAIFATTPNGRNWIYDLYQRGRLRDGGYRSLRVPTRANPYIDPAEIDRARATLPPSIFAQEWLAKPGAGDDSLIPYEWLVEAGERWRAWAEAGKAREGRYILGVDVAEGGGDRAVMAHRWGDVVAELEDVTPRTRGDMEPIGHRVTVALEDAGKGAKGLAIIDAVGVGAQLPSFVRRRGGRCMAYKGSAGTKLRDSTGTFGFTNLRAASWWHARELLAPGSTIALPPDPALFAELSAPRIEKRAGARLALEPKDNVRKRLGRSPDRADAVVMALWDRTLMR